MEYLPATAELPINPNKKEHEIRITMEGCSVASDLHSDRNEDAIAHDVTSGMALVADGLGGYVGGDKASRFIRKFVGNRRNSLATNNTPMRIEQNIRETLEVAAQEIVREIPHTGAAVTMVQLTKSMGKIWAVFGHVGDTRAYIERRGTLTQITQDDGHSMTDGEKNKLDTVVTQKDYESLNSHRQFLFNTRNEIAQYIGSDNEGENAFQKVHTYSRKLEEGDRIILVSDGVHDNLPLTGKSGVLGIKNILERNPQNTARALVEEAQRVSRLNYAETIRAKPDDISAIVITIGERKNGNPPQKRSFLEKVFGR